METTWVITTSRSMTAHLAEVGADAALCGVKRPARGWFETGSLNNVCEGKAAPHERCQDRLMGRSFLDRS